MALSSEISAANTPGLLADLVGERVKAAFVDDGKLYIVVEGGDALVLADQDGVRAPAYWHVRAYDVRRVVAARRRLINAKIEELRAMAGVDGLPQPFESVAAEGPDEGGMDPWPVTES